MHSAYDAEHTHTRALASHEIHGRECMKSRVFSDCGGDSGRFGRDFARRRQFECGPHGETTCNTDASTSRATQGQRTHMHAASGRSQTVWLTIDNIKTTFISSILVYERAIFSATLHCNTTSSMKRYGAHTPTPTTFCASINFYVDALQFTGMFFYSTATATAFRSICDASHFVIIILSIASSIIHLSCVGGFDSTAYFIFIVLFRTPINE